MSGTKKASIAIVFAVGIAGCSASSGVSTQGPAGINVLAAAATTSGEHFTPPANAVRACPESHSLEYAACDALVRTDIGASSISGYGPADLQSAYNLPSATAGAGQTIAIVDAYDDPNAESDLAFYRSTFGLPACSGSSGCFQKLNQEGKAGPYPRADIGWTIEISLDVQMVSAGCPKCHIVLVEANDNEYKNLGAAVAAAVKSGADAVSNSYGSRGNYKASSIFKYYDYSHPVILASAGDGGYSPAIPAGFPTVVAIGGTTLNRSSGGRGWSETVWGDKHGNLGTGSGCNTKQVKPAWQLDRGCKGRTMNDVSAIADPLTGVAVYDTYYRNGWMVLGGTSVSSPLIASMYGLAGNGDQLDAAQSLYAGGASLYDITIGRNGICVVRYLCRAEIGYDGPTGNGTPNGVTAF